MAVSNALIFVYSNGEKVKNSKDLELLLKSVSVSADGNDNGMNITEVSGAFSFNSKKLSGVADGAAVSDAATKGQMDTALALKIDATEKGAANGVATLGADSKIPSAQIPALAISSVSVVADQAAQLALANQEGDVVVRTDEGKTYIHNGGSAGDMTDYTEIVAPGTGVTSVNGQAGPSVTLDSDDITEGASNLYYTEAHFDASLAAKSTADLAEGSNLYYTDARVDSRVGIVKSYVNGEAGDITVRQIVVKDATGKAKLALANQSLSKGSHFMMVKDATIATTASGNFYEPKKGTRVSGFVGLTADAPVYIDRATAGAYTQDLSAFVSGEHVVSIGYAVSATEIVFDPQYEFQFA